MAENRRFIVAKTILSASLVAMPVQAQPVRDPCQPLASCPNEVEADTSVPPYLMVTAPASESGTQDGPTPEPGGRIESRGRSSDAPSEPADDSDAPPETAPEDGETDADDEDGGSDLPEVLAVATGVVVVAAVASALLGSNWASPADLYRHGPRFSRRQRLGQLRVQGFVRSGWPFVVDLETESGVTTWLEVSVKGMDRRHFLPLEGDGRRVAYVQMPELENDELRVARLTLHSAVLRPGAPPDYRPLRVHSMAAGPYAVASASLAMASLQPGAGAYGSPTFWIGSIAPRQARSPDAVQFSLMARRPYEQARVEVLRLPRSPDGRLSRVGAVTLTPLLEGPSRHGWRQIGVNPRPAQGVYLVQAKAWRTTRNQGDWTGARAPGLVTIQ